MFEDDQESDLFDFYFEEFTRLQADERCGWCDERLVDGLCPYCDEDPSEEDDDDYDL